MQKTRKLLTLSKLIPNFTSLTLRTYILVFEKEY